MSHAATLNELVAEAIIGIDTLWGGDVMSPSGTGRFLADCWFSEQPLPYAYSHPAAAALRETGGVAAASPDHAAIDAYLTEISPHFTADGSLDGRPSRNPRKAFWRGCHPPRGRNRNAVISSDASQLAASPTIERRRES